MSLTASLPYLAPARQNAEHRLGKHDVAALPKLLRLVKIPTGPLIFSFAAFEDIGASQSDIANLNGEDVDWQTNSVSFVRKKSGVPVVVHLGSEALNLLKDLPAEGQLFPYLSTVRAGDRATEFASRCRQLAIKGVTLHSYRYAWAERAKVAGMPERFAQEALGHNSKAVHRAYAKRALVKIPSLEEYEKGTATKSPNGTD